MNPTDEQLDPLGLGFDANAVDTSRPLLAPNRYVFNVDYTEVKPNKAGTGRNLVVTFSLAEPTQSAPLSDGTTVTLEKYKLTKYYPLQPSEKNPVWDWKADPIRLQDACLGTKQGNRPPFNPADFVGKSVLIAVKTTTSDDSDRGPQNEIAGIYPVPTETVA